MANKTIDRKKAIAARSQAARAGTKSANSRTSEAAAKEEEQSSLELAADERSASSDVLDEEELEAGDEGDEEEAEASDSEDEEDEGEAVEETRALAKPAERRISKQERRERNPEVRGSQDYSVSVSKPAGSFLPDYPVVRFVRSSIRELSLVTWPSRQDTWNWSLVVVGVCLFVGVLLGAADFALTQFVQWWISLAH